MDSSVLQAAQRVMNWHLQHTVLPSPPAQAPDGAGDAEPGSATASDSQAESDGWTPQPASHA